MYKAAKMVFDLLQKRKYETYYIGGKCRTELHNQYHPNLKITIKDIDFVTNATIEEVKKIFPTGKIRGENFQIIAINFGGFEFEIATFRKDININEVKKNKKSAIEAMEKLNEDRSYRDFTINAVAEDIDGNYIDYVYNYRNQKISAIKDIKDCLIRAIGNPRQRFLEDPLRILRAFRFVSQLGYDIEKQTLKAIESNLGLLEKIPHERIQGEMTKILLGQKATEALILMKSMNIFKLKVFNSIKNQLVDFLPGVNDIEDDHFKILNQFNNNPIPKNTNNTIEIWTILLKPLGVKEARRNLESIYPLSNNDIEKVEWLIEYYDLIDSKDIRNDIFNARTGIVQRLKLMCMRELIKINSDIHLILNGVEYETKAVDFMNAFCSRPYFPEQLKLTGEQIMEIANEGPGPWITNAKEKFLFKLINSKKVVPRDSEEYMELANEAIEEAIFEITMHEQGLI